MLYAWYAGGLICRLRADHPIGKDYQVKHIMNVNGIRRLQRSIMAYTTLGVLAASIIIATVSILPLYKQLKDDQENSLLLMLKMRSMAVNEYLTRIKSIASQISSRSLIGAKLDAYDKGEIDLKSLRDFSLERVEDALRYSDEVAGISRLDRSGRKVLELGFPIADNLWPVPAPESRTVLVGGVELSGSEPYVLIGSPVFNRHMERIGTDVFLFKTGILRNIVQDYSGLGESGEVMVGYVDGDRAQLLFPLRNSEDEAGRAGILPSGLPVCVALVKASRGGSGMSSIWDGPDHHPDLISFGPLEAHGWGIAVKMDEQELYARVYRQVALTCSIIAALGLLSMFGMGLLLRPLTGKMIIHSDELNRQIREKTAVLEKELSERKEAEKALERLRKRDELILSSAAEGILGVDTEENVIFINPAASNMIGWKESEILGRSFHSNIWRSTGPGLADTGNVCPVCAAFRAGAVRRGAEAVFRRNEKESFSVEYASAPIKEGEKLMGAVLVFSDMSERASKEDELRMAKEIAEAANRTKSEFVASMSHEFRTPLNAIIGFSELILDGRFGKLNAEQREFLGDVLQSANHLLALINDILDLSKIEAGKLRLNSTELNLEDIVRRSLFMVRETAMHHKVGLSTEFCLTQKSIMADERKLKQILYNLLSNAVKFTPDGGSVRVRAVSLSADQLEALGDSAPKCLFQSGARSERDEFIEIEVTDTGIGLSEGDLERIFNPFEQVDSSFSRKYYGTGLGLSLVKRLVELHEGVIWAESKGEGMGSSFRFIMPARRAGMVERS